jgi:CRISPR-associated endonuclease/helicase Cas3
VASESAFAPPLAHSARPAKGISAQSYPEHIANVSQHTYEAMVGAQAYRSGGPDPKLLAAVQWSSAFHDLGKLAPENQSVLQGCDGERLPTPHEDAGAAYCIENKQTAAAWVVSQHHSGLKDFAEEKAKAELNAQNPASALFRNPTVKLDTDAKLDSLVNRHKQACGPLTLDSRGVGALGRTPWDMRLLMSCLVAGDHGDTARHYQQEPALELSAPRWEERLVALDSYVAELASHAGARNDLRQSIYVACRQASPEIPIWACDAPVGSGKTTAVMAYLLQAAIALNLRHIFVVLPFTNIVNQSVDVYRKALVLPDEDPKEIVAAHHHASEFETPTLRALTTTWSSPVIVTTAVQFFETLAASATPRLRKLHALPGSAVFIDEAHAAMPLFLWPYMWGHLDFLSSRWNCRFVLGSGSLPRFWEDTHLFGEGVAEIPSMLSRQLAQCGNKGEKERVCVETCAQTHTLDSLCTWIRSFPGARLVVMNTVQSAAALARKLDADGVKTLHLSTALSPKDRESILKRVCALLTPGKQSADGWVLVATSCIEAGVDVSFDIAFRERSSISSLIQIGGRANRHASPGVTAQVWDFVTSDPWFNRNPALDRSIRVVQQAFVQGKWRMTLTDLMTWAVAEEWKQWAKTKEVDELILLEKELAFESVSAKARLIDEDRALAVVDAALAKEIRGGRYVSRNRLLQGSVSIRRSVLEKVRPTLTPGEQEIYLWPDGKYDAEFLGIMSYVLELATYDRAGLALV